MFSCSEQQYGNTRKYNVRKIENCYAIPLSIEDIKDMNFTLFFYARYSEVVIIELNDRNLVIPTTIK